MNRTQTNTVNCECKSYDEYGVGDGREETYEERGEVDRP